MRFYKSLLWNLLFFPLPWEKSETDGDVSACRVYLFVLVRYVWMFVCLFVCFLSLCAFSARSSCMHDFFSWIFKVLFFSYLATSLRIHLSNGPSLSGMWSRSFKTIGSLSNDDANGNENVKKAIGLDWQNNNFARASRFFCTFLCRRCPTTTWKCLNSRFFEDGNTWQQLSFLFLNCDTVL